MENVKIKSKIRLTDIAADERLYEMVAFDVDVTLFKDRLKLNAVSVDERTAGYIQSIGSTAKHWMDEMKSAFENDPDYMLECMVDRMSEHEWQIAKPVVMLYNEK